MAEGEAANQANTGKVAVVTGAGSGLGRMTARLLQQQGVTVVPLDQSAAGLAGVTGELGLGAEAGLRCDVTRPDDVQAAAEQVRRRYGRCDILVNNAGILTRGALEEETVEAWDRVFAVNLRGYFLCAQAFGRSMLAQGSGAIVNIASIGALVPTMNAGAYCAAKAGVIALTRQMALEWGPRGVRANSVSPGFMQTGMTAEQYQVPGLQEQRAAMVPLGRISRVEEVASVVAFLAGDGASFVNGENVLVDGGMLQTTMRRVPHASDYAAK